jgi:hypothetical protein
MRRSRVGRTAIAALVAVPMAAGLAVAASTGAVAVQGDPLPPPDCGDLGDGCPAFDVGILVNVFGQEVAGITGGGWQPNSMVTVTADDPDTPDIDPDISTMAPTDPDGSFQVPPTGVPPVDWTGAPVEFYAEAGWTVEVSDDAGNFKDHVVIDVVVTGASATTDTISGVAPAGSTVIVLATNDPTVPGSSEPPPARVVTTTAKGTWTANFSGLVDLAPDTWGQAVVYDDNHDDTQYGMPTPYEGVGANQPSQFARTAGSFTLAGAYGPDGEFGFQTVAHETLTGGDFDGATVDLTFATGISVPPQPLFESIPNLVTITGPDWTLTGYVSNVESFTFGEFGLPGTIGASIRTLTVTGGTGIYSWVGSGEIQEANTFEIISGFPNFTAESSGRFQAVEPFGPSVPGTPLRVNGTVTGGSETIAGTLDNTSAEIDSTLTLAGGVLDGTTMTMRYTVNNAPTGFGEGHEVDPSAPNTVTIQGKGFTLTGHVAAQRPSGCFGGCLFGNSPGSPGQIGPPYGFGELRGIAITGGTGKYSKVTGGTLWVDAGGNINDEGAGYPESFTRQLHADGNTMTASINFS